MSESVMATTCKLSRGRFTGFLYRAGDLLFLMIVGVVATLSMSWIHRLGWNLVIALIAGMMLAMMVQMALTLAVSPILGHRESMVPAMSVAMIAPMVVCVFDLIGLHARWHWLVFLGLLLGASAYCLAARCGCYRGRVRPQQ